MNLSAEARKLLESSKYRTYAGASEDIFYFEDSSLLGFVWIAPSPDMLVKEWQRLQDSFLREKDLQLRNSKDKSWNAYSVLLTEPDAAGDQVRALLKIEEDFRGTRKIAKAGLRTTGQLMKALLPLLAIQNLVELERDESKERLRSRLSRLDPALLEALLEQEKPEEAGKMMVSHYENSED
ncbi:MAG TPA: hypothetical protein VK829_08350 [Terriglobales bacterium]|jgi:hypothetical protein|nr:hypothetical protein [Terriglobales bacterium]